MAVSKMIYFSGDVFEQATKGIEKGDISKRINDLVQRGLKVEEKGDKVSVKDIIISLVRWYNNKRPNDKIVL